MLRFALLRLLSFVFVLGSILPMRPPLVAPAKTAALPLAAPLVAPHSLPLSPPAQAHSTSLPASSATTFQQQYETEHSLGRLEEGFDTPRSAPTLIPGPIALTGTSVVEHVVSLPAGTLDSLDLDVTVRTIPVEGENNPPSARAWIAARAAGSSTWSSAMLLAESVGFQPGTVAGQRVTLGWAAPQHRPLEILLRCEGNNGRQIACSWANLRFATDVPGWHYAYPDGRMMDMPTVKEVRIGARSDPIQGIAPWQGSFLAIETFTYPRWGAPSGEPILLESPIIQLPARTSPITISLSWARALTGASGSANGAFIVLKTLTNYPETVLEIPIGGASDWATMTATLPHYFADIPVRIQIIFTTGQAPHVLALDNLTIGGGAPFVIPADQVVGVCSCAAGGNVQTFAPNGVNTSAGALLTQATDLEVGSGGPPLRFERSYVSLLADPLAYPTTVLGPGWRHSFAAALTLPTQTGGENGFVIYEAPSGNRLRFHDDGLANTILDPLPGIRATLIRSGGSYTLMLRDQSVLRFDSQGRLTKQIDPEGHTQQFSYHAAPGSVWDGQLERVTDSATQRSLTFSYTSVAGQPRLQAVHNPLNQGVQFSYTANGDLAGVTDLRGGVTTYAYAGGSHLLTSIQDPLSVTRLSTSYDSERRVSSQVDASGLTTTYAYQDTPSGRVSTITRQPIGMPADVAIDHYRPDRSLRFQERNGQFQGYLTFDRSLAPTIQVNGNGSTTRVRNNRSGLPLQVVDAAGRISTASHRADNRPARLLSPDNSVTTWSYDTLGNLSGVSKRGADGLLVLQTMSVTADRRPLTQQSPGGTVTRYSYDALGQISQFTVGYGTSVAQTSSFGYDALGRVITTTIGAGTALARVDTISYNADSTIARTVQNYRDGLFDPAHPDEDIITTYGYDLLGRPIWVRDALGRYQATHYDARGRVNWTVRNLVGGGFSGGALPATPPAYNLAAPDANVATFYGYDRLGRTALVTQTGILTGTFSPSTLHFSSATTRVTRTEYDSFSRPVTVTLNYRPDLPFGTLPDANLTTLTYYDGVGNPIWQRDGLGRWTSTIYDALGRIVRTIRNYENGDPLTVDASNQGWTDGSDTDLIQVTTYDTTGRVERTIENYVDGVFTASAPITDQITLYQYDSLSRVITTTLNYAPNQMGSALNRTSVTSYDASTAQVRGERDTVGAWTSYQHDELGRLVATIQNCRDSAGNPIVTGCATTIGVGQDQNIRSQTRYDALGRAFETIDPLLSVTRTSYDGLGRTTAVTQNYVVGSPTTPITNVTSLSAYDALGQVTRTTDPLNASTRQGYDRLGQTVVVTDTMGHVTRLGYDGSGTQRWRRRADGQLTVTQLDGLGRITVTILNYQDGEVGIAEPTDQDLITRVMYDAGGRKVRTIDASGRVTDFVYDLNDRLIGVIEHAVSGSCTLPPCNVVTRYTYDRAGNRTAIADANGHTRRFGYDAMGQMVAATDALGRTTEWTYDVGGRMTSRVDGRGLGVGEVQYGYDGMGRQTTVWDLAYSLPYEQRYDALGRRTFVDDLLHTTSYSYDPLSQITAVESSLTGEVRYSYNARGERTQLIYPDGTSLNYSYRADGQLQTVSQGASTLASYSYDSVGRLSGLNAANGKILTGYGYDDADRLRGMITNGNPSGTVYQELSRFEYTLDRMGRRTEAEEHLGSVDRTISYDYDGLGRLIDASSSTGADYHYAYDLAGNRTEVRVNGLVSEQYSYDAADQVTGWQYDAAGNLTSDSTAGYGYDGLGRMTTRTAGNVTTEYSYTLDGVLVQRTQAGSVISYTQDLAAPLSQVLQIAQGGTTTDYLYGLTRLASVSSGVRTWYSGDGLGSVRMVLNDAGAPLSTVSYDPWGQVESGSVPTFGFTGELQDASAGLVYLRARWYNTSHGTFTTHRWQTNESNDLNPYSHHPYAYALGNPVLLTDPSGKCVPEHLTIFGVTIPVPGGEAGCSIEEGAAKGRYDIAGAGKVLVTGGGVAATIVVCAATALLGCALGGAGAAAVSSWGNQALDNAGQPVEQAATNVNWGTMARDAGIALVSSPLGGLAGKGVVRFCSAGAWCSTAIGGAMGFVSSGVSRGLTNLLDFNPETSLTTGLLESCVGGGLFGGFVGRISIRLPTVKPYGDLEGTFPPGSGVQAHHLNQNAAYKSQIPEDEGIAVGMRGNAFTERGSPHYNFHQRMEQFWDQFRRFRGVPGPRFGQVPSNAEYSQAVYQSARHAGLPEIYARALQTAAQINRLAYGLKESDLVPNIPRRINQR